MITSDKKQILNQVKEEFNREELIWTLGYLTAVAENTSTNNSQNDGIPNKPTATQSTSAEATSAAASKIEQLSIVYITDTGNAKNIALSLAKTMKAEGVSCNVKAANQYKESNLKKDTNLLLVVSTAGDGEIPESGKKFETLLKTKPHLANLNYSIIALGDSSYPLFCEAGKQFDQLLKESGAQEFIPLKMVDVDLSMVETEWLESFEQAQTQTATSTAEVSENLDVEEGLIIENTLMNDIKSNKRVHHIAIQTNQHYEPGDSLKFIPTNSEDEAKAILKALHIREDEKIKLKTGEFDILQALQNQLEISRVRVKNINKLFNSGSLEIQTGEPEKLEDLTLLEVIKEKADLKNRVSAQDLADALNPIRGRLYSISSSKNYHEGEVHVTVAAHNFRNKTGQEKLGKASHALINKAEGEKIEISVHQNSLFRVAPENKDIIMIGPGTGIAPFRAFLWEREHQGASGRNWLFFGDQKFSQDFLYQLEIQELYETGLLTKVNTAFSRDQEEKIYVQDRIRENATEFVNWIDSGAHIYICGAKRPMSEDVESTIIEVIAQEKGISKEAAEEVLEDLANQERYLKDVY